MSAESATQGALYAAITALGYRCYDVAPQATNGGSDAVFPYVTVGMIVAAPFDTFSEPGHDLACRIHTYSRSGSMLECRTVQGAVYSRLHRGTLAVTGFSLIDVTRELSDCTRMADGSFHGVCEYRVVLTT